MKTLAREDLEHIERHTHSLWERARGKRLFLTGTTGFFGAWLLESLAYCNRVLDLRLSASVLCRNPEAVVARLPHLGREEFINWIQGDIRTYTFPSGEFEFVIHAATPTTGATNLDAFDLLSTIIDGTRRTIDFARERQARSFLYISSGAVYGPPPESMACIPEHYRGALDWMHPNAAYAEGKRVAEMMCTIMAHETGIDVRIARCFAFVGPHLPLEQHFAIGNFIADALAGRDISIRGDGTALRSYLYASDLALWLWTLLLMKTDSKGAPAVYNVGSGEAISIKVLAEHLTAELNPNLKIKISRHAASGASPSQYVPDVRKAALLGLRPHVGLREAIRRTATWYR